jgi:ribosome-associated translation inhibitor RaiA
LLLLHWKISFYIAITSAFISLFYYAFYINRQKIKEFSNKFENLKDIIDDPDASENLKTFAKTKLKRLETHIKDSIQISFFLIMTPLVPMFFIGDIGKVFLDFTMQKTGVRIDKATLYIKAPYATLINLPKTTNKELNQYQTYIFKDIKVLFQGIGKNTLISYKVKNIEKQIVIPNEYIIIESSRKVDE